jgi:hypothetical protein
MRDTAALSLTTYPLWWQHQAGGAFNAWAAAARRRSPRQGPLPLRTEALGSHTPAARQRQW